MKSIAWMLVLLVAFAAAGCDGGDGEEDASQAEAENSLAAERERGEPRGEEASGARECFPGDYRLPGDFSTSGDGVTLITTVGNPGDPYYSVTTLSSGRTERVYSDGSVFRETQFSTDERVESGGVTNTSRSVELRTRVKLFDGSEIGQFLFEQFENGARVARQYLAAIECSDGQFAAISQREFERYRRAMGF